MSLFDALWRAGALRTLDHAFAQSLRRLDADTDPQVLAATALTSLAVAQGHAALDLSAPGRVVDDALAAHRMAEDSVELPPWPTLAQWQQVLSASRWVAQPAHRHDIADAGAPLVLEGGLLYLRRYREYERRLAAGLQRIATALPAPSSVDALAPLFAKLFAPAPELATDDADHQARAAALALRHGLLLITGGPGTGKTTTIARVLVLLAALAQQTQQEPPRIALAAPTGRAAERMAQSLRHARALLDAQGLPAPLLDALPSGASTLHRLLGTIPDSPQFRHNADNPLSHSIIVVDEASMVDLPLMTKLVEAVPDGARLILLGDADQLPSVEAGDVLAAILRAAGDGDAFDAVDAQALAPLLGTRMASLSASPSVFAGRRVHLQRGYRQQGDFDLAPLAQAVRAGDADASLALLRAGQLRGVHFHPTQEDPLQPPGQALLTHWRALATQDDPAHALAQSAQLRLLTAVREGPQGARTLNARIEQQLQGQRSGLARGLGEAYFHGRLLLITENSYTHRLFNGDIGICLRDDSGRVVAWFPGSGDGALRAFHPATLPAHESAFAMTVHKAQGSEFDAVWLALPARDNRVLSRELIYTGITRARRQLHLLANESVMRVALSRHASRWSGLQQRLESPAS